MKDNEHSVVDMRKYAKSVLQQRHEPEPDEAAETFKEARAKSREALMLDVRLAGGDVVSFPYAHLARVTYRTSGVIVLRFGADTVTAEGRNLHRLRDAVSEHRAKFIQEGTEAEEGIKPEDAPHIDRIVITEGQDGL